MKRYFLLLFYGLFFSIKVFSFENDSLKIAEKQELFTFSYFFIDQASVLGTNTEINIINSKDYHYGLAVNLSTSIFTLPLYPNIHPDKPSNIIVSLRPKVRLLNNHIVPFLELGLGNFYLKKHITCDYYLFDIDTYKDFHSMYSVLGVGTNLNFNHFRIQLKVSVSDFFNYDSKFLYKKSAVVPTIALGYNVFSKKEYLDDDKFKRLREKKNTLSVLFPGILIYTHNITSYNLFDFFVTTYFMPSFFDVYPLIAGGFGFRLNMFRRFFFSASLISGNMTNVLYTKTFGLRISDKWSFFIMNFQAVYKVMSESSYEVVGIPFDIGFRFSF